MPGKLRGKLDDAEPVGVQIAYYVDLIKKQVMLDIIGLASSCDTYEEFKKALYGEAIAYVAGLEDGGIVKKGTVEKLAKGGKLEDSDVN